MDFFKVAGLVAGGVAIIAGMFAVALYIHGGLVAFAVGWFNAVNQALFG